MSTQIRSCLFIPHLEGTLSGKKTGTRPFCSFSSSTGETHSAAQYVDAFLIHVKVIGDRRFSEYNGRSKPLSKCSDYSHNLNIEL